MLGFNGQSGPKPNTGTPERSLVTKKSKTEPTDALGPDDSQAALSPGTAGRCISPTLAVNSASAVTYLGGATGSSDSDASNFNLSDRDYVFPCNLVPYSTRRNLSTNPFLLFCRSSRGYLNFRLVALPSPNLSGSAVDSRRSSKTKLKADKDLKVLSFQASNAALAPSPRVNQFVIQLSPVVFRRIHYSGAIGD